MYFHVSSNKFSTQRVNKVCLYILHGDAQVVVIGTLMICLTLNVRGPSYLGLTRSVPWLLIPWLLMSPGHQQP